MNPTAAGDDETELFRNSLRTITCCSTIERNDVTF